MVKFGGINFFGNRSKKIEPAKPQLDSVEQTKLLILIAIVLSAIALAVYAAGALSQSSQTGQLSLATCARQFTVGAQDQCVAALANQTNNLSVCGVLPTNPAYSCYFGTAMHEQNISACKLVSGYEPLHESCILNLVSNTMNLSYCGDLMESDGLWCIYNISNKAGFSSLSACGGIGNTLLSNECRYLYYYKNAVIQNNPNYCSYLQPQGNQTTLYTLLQNYTRTANYINTNVTLYSWYMEENVSPRDYCYYRLAVIEKNAGLCSFTTTKAGSALCKAVFEGGV